MYSWIYVYECNHLDCVKKYFNLENRHVCFNKQNQNVGKVTLRVGFEPTREIPIGFQVQRLKRLNHSAIAADLCNIQSKVSF